MTNETNKKEFERVTFSNDNKTLNLFLVKKWTDKRFGVPIEFTLAADEPIYSTLDETTPIYQLSDELYECMKSTLYSHDCYLQADVKGGTMQGQYLTEHSKDKHWESIDDLDIEMLSSLFLKNEIGQVVRSNFEYWAGGTLGHYDDSKVFYTYDNAYYKKEKHFDDLENTIKYDIYKVDYQDVVDEFAKAHKLTELDCVVDNSGEFWCHDEIYGDGNISYSICDKQLKEDVIAATANKELDLTDEQSRGRS